MPPVRPRPRPVRRTVRRTATAAATVLAAALLAVALGGCTLVEQTHYVVQQRSPGHQVVHLTPVVSFQLILLRDVHCNHDVGCAAAWLRESLAVEGSGAETWRQAFADLDQLDTAISVAKATYDPDRGALKCVLAYDARGAGGPVGWGNTDDPAWCRQPSP